MYNLMLGDCLERMKEIPDGSIDMVLCDLPYGITQNKWDSVIPFDSLWEEYKRIIKKNGAIVLFGNEPFSSCLMIPKDISDNLIMFMVLEYTLGYSDVSFNKYFMRCDFTSYRVPYRKPAYLYYNYDLSRIVIDILKDKDTAISIMIRKINERCESMYLDLSM